MLHSVKELQGYGIGATDGDIGSVKDFYFDDSAWIIRYVVAETGSWLGSSRKVLISPMAMGPANAGQRVLPTLLKRQQVKDSPHIDTDKPVSRQHESELLRYYDYPYYWGGSGLWGDGLVPNQMISDYETHPVDAKERAIRDAAYGKIERSRHARDDPHLRSCNAVIGYHIEAADGEIGQVQDMLVDDETWALRYLVVKTSNGWLGQQVVIAPSWVQAVSWEDQKVVTKLTRDAIRTSPLYDPSSLFNRTHESDIYAHHKYPGYWQSEAFLRKVGRQVDDKLHTGE
jgi:sporulation protein YlmC with PRC-barrel domain